ncbi:PREDICTED: TBC1 domain family member 1-like [Chinchilla lanigera]|uniref:TBC1 domain family member 1-like n=1 Tax=Chinchilla lanigera TaxID=34839 RepID=UPI000698A759|nr:PREDICTED: TBC1 domain family member 1-like [Chinchilla lanigera]
MEETTNWVAEINMAKQLLAYEIERLMLQELTGSSSLCDNQRINKLEKSNNSLCKQNLDLLEQLQVAHSRLQSLEAIAEKLLTNESKLKQASPSLELEGHPAVDGGSLKAAYQGSHPLKLSTLSSLTVPSLSPEVTALHRNCTLS